MIHWLISIGAVLWCMAAVAGIKKALSFVSLDLNFVWKELGLVARLSLILTTLFFGPLIGIFILALERSTKDKV